MMFGYNESLKGEKNALSFHGVCILVEWVENML